MSDIAMMVLAGLVLSSLVYLLIFYIAYKKTNRKSVESFYLGGRDFGGIVLFLTIGASWFSMWFLLGAPGAFYKHGTGFATFFMLNVVLGLLFFVYGRRMWLLGKVFKYTTPGDLLEHYYQSRSIKTVSAILNIYLLFPYIGIQLLGAGLAFEAIGSSFWLGVITMIVLVTLFSVFGGIKAVAWKDALQGFFYMGFTWLVAFWMVKSGITGFDSLKDLFVSVDSTYPKFLQFPGESGYFTPANWFGYFAIYVFAGICLPHLWTRFYMAKNMDVFKTVTVGHIAFASWGFVPILIIALLGKMILPDIEKVDQIFPLLLLEYSPILAVVLIVCAFAAAMSTIDSQNMAMGTVFTKDIWLSLVDNNSSERTQMLVGRISTVVLMAISVIWTFTSEGSILKLSMIAFTSAALLFMPLTGALFYKKAGPLAATWSVIVGVLV
ncbi:sodium:solute symporter family protein, partial [Marinobacter sp.]|uniref:sodium:solute symporter family protein n=1 Tax=Marinobacter sp. TaxID=50741 RepID=UPI003561A026